MSSILLPDSVEIGKSIGMGEVWTCMYLGKNKHSHYHKVTVTQSSTDVVLLYI